MKVSTQGTLLALWAIATTSTVYGAILGIDLGSLYMKVALVKRGAPLEIVTNLHSKRKTEQMILFDQGTRFYGADASSLLARKPTKTPGGFTVMLGRDEEHPAVKVSLICSRNRMSGLSSCPMGILDSICSILTALTTMTA